MTAPPGMRYAVAIWSRFRNPLDGPRSIAFFRDIAGVVECMVDLGIAFICEVVRVDGNVTIWPLQTKGGDRC